MCRGLTCVFYRKGNVNTVPVERVEMRGDGFAGSKSACSAKGRKEVLQRHYKLNTLGHGKNGNDV